MANIDQQINNLWEIIAEDLPVTAACWTAVQQAATLDVKNKAGYELFNLMVGLSNCDPLHC